MPEYRLFDAGTYLYSKWKHQRLTISGGTGYDNRKLTASNFDVGKDPQTGFGKQVADLSVAGAALLFGAISKIFWWQRYGLT